MLLTTGRNETDNTGMGGRTTKGSHNLFGRDTSGLSVRPNHDLLTLCCVLVYFMTKSLSNRQQEGRRGDPAHVLIGA